jgi:hypothetical protein
VHVNRVLKYAAHDWARPFFKIILDTVFPARCLVCSRLFEPAITRPGMGRSTNAATEITCTFAESHLLLPGLRKLFYGYFIADLQLLWDYV